jgi:Tol biopolymer transport system component/DNA-binding winged helix-turn-helix (wHTH) protein
MSLTPKLFDTLLVLVESQGRILDKEDLLKKVWPDTFVEEVSLAKKVSILRKVLGEDSSHAYIETIPRRGYRFVAEVREVWEEGPAAKPSNGHLRPAAPALAPPPDEQADSLPAPARPTQAALRALPHPPRHFTAKLGWSISALALLLLAGQSARWLIGRMSLGAASHASKASLPALNAVPLTSYQGSETQAAFSPSGNQIAFVWTGPQDQTANLYVKLVDAETPLRLTSTAAADSKPAWSPDGRNITFVRQSAQGDAFYMIPALGGAERKLADIFPAQIPNDGNSPYFSPDGKWLAIPDKATATAPLSLFLLAVDTREKRRLTAPPADAVGDHYPAFSPDGKLLAFVRETQWSVADLYVMPASGGEPRRLTFDDLPIVGLAWTPDSRELLFTSRRGGSTRHLWRVPASGGPPERVETVGNDVISPALSARGNRLAYTQTLDDINIWQIELDAAGHAKAQQGLVASTFWDHGPDFSPDGQKIVFASGRSGSAGIWVCESDGSKARLLSACGPHVTGTPRWSPDGRWIVFDSRSCVAGQPGNPDVYLVSADGGQPRRLTTDAAEDVVPSWSHDGQWVYFGSNRGGSMHVWKISVAGGETVQVTPQAGFESYESPDGKYLYYTKGRNTPGIWRIPTAGGTEEFVTDQQKAGQWRYWRVTDQGIYFAATTNTGPVIEFFNFATRRVTEVVHPTKGPEKNIPGLAVAPNGHTLLYVQRDRSGSDLMMVEDFR